jgi:predicted Rossmann-fold nucleotide-binding protein
MIHADAPRSPGDPVEVDTLDAFDALVAAGSTSMAGWRLQSVDLTGRSEVLRSLDPAGALVLGCRLRAADHRWLHARGAMVFHEIPDLPFDAYRAALYTALELYAGVQNGYEATPDARIYAWSQSAVHGDVATMLAQGLHDLAVDDALDEFVAGRRLVGVMGGHALARGTPAYAEAARLGQALAAQGLVVCTGGGPGAMEAANLGARAANLDQAALEAVLEVLAGTPDYRPSVQPWAQAALGVLHRLDAAGRPVRTLGIPTWFYGHEPPNAFATDVAKYFRNAVREDVLLRVCNAGIVFLPGAAGTVQEIFQDACENYYAEPAARAPMVLVGREYWTRTLPAWPLLKVMAEAKGFSSTVWLVDSWTEVCPLLA